MSSTEPEPAPASGPDVDGAAVTETEKTAAAESECGGGAEDLLSPVYSISEKQFNRGHTPRTRRRRSPSHSEEYVAPVLSHSSSNSNSDYDSDFEFNKKKVKRKTKAHYSCPDCPYTTKRRDYFAKHLKIHAKQTFECVLLDSKAGILSEPREEIVPSEPAFVPPLLPDVLEIPDSADEENPPAKKQKKKRFKCNRCDFNSPIKMVVKAHKRCHFPVHTIKCPKCRYASTDQQTMDSHLKIHSSGSKQYKCDICDRLFAEVMSLTQHKTQHYTTEHYFKCGICPYKCVALV